MTTLLLTTTTTTRQRGGRARGLGAPATYLCCRQCAGARRHCRGSGHSEQAIHQGLRVHDNRPSGGCILPGCPRRAGHGAECRYIWHCCCMLLHVRLTYSFQSPLEVGHRIGMQYWFNTCTMYGSTIPIVWGLSDLRPSQKWRMRRTSHERLRPLCCLEQGLTPFLVSATCVD